MTSVLPDGEDRAAPRFAVRHASLGAVVVGLRRRPRLAAFLSGAVATLAMPPVFAWPVLYAVFYCLVRLLDDIARGSDDVLSRSALKVRASRGFVVGWMFGFGYFAVGLYWISASLFVEPDKFLWLLPFSVTLIPAGLAVFYGVGLAVAAMVWRPGLPGVVTLALTLTVTEWLRGHLFTGLPWNTLGYALTAPPLLLQSASLLGTYALTFIAVLIFALPAAVVTGRPRGALRHHRALGIAAGSSALALMALAAFGAYRLSLPEPAEVPGVRLRLVQPNISQDMKWRGENRAAIFRGYLDRSRRNPKGEDDGLAGITHVIWPESAIPFLLLGSQEALDAIAGLLPDGTNLITGAIRLETVPQIEGQPPLRRVYNSLLALDDRAHLTGVYDKLHLVPFGEYLPFQKTLEAVGLRQLTRLQGGFAAGDAATARYWEVPGLPPISPLICYESIFPDEVVTRGRRPGFFLNVTNDGWFGKTVGPHQHLHQARVRAVEQGLPLIRVANTGVSAVVDGRGRVLQRAGLGEIAVIDTALPGALPPTPYSRSGGSAVLLVLVLGSAWLGLLRARALSPED